MDDKETSKKTLQQILCYAGGIFLLASVLDFIPTGTLHTIVQSLGTFLIAFSFLFDSESSKGIRIFFAFALVVLTIVNLLSA